MSKNKPITAVAFLDVDDVLSINALFNTRQVLAALAGDPSVNANDVWTKVFHVPACSNLRALHEEFALTYVISSSWTKHLTREQLCETFRRTGLEFVAENLHEFWCTPRNDETYRLVEIDGWIDQHLMMSPLPFVILDDLISGQSIPGSHLENNAVLCDGWVGFTHPKLRAAQKILREQLKLESSAGGAARKPGPLRGARRN